MRDWDSELTPEERDSLVERVATAISRRRLEVPAILFLEMHKPLAFVASQGIVVGSPFIAPLLGLENVQLTAKLLEKRENVERLIQRIEEMAQSRKLAPSHPHQDPAAP